MGGGGPDVRRLGDEGVSSPVSDLLRREQKFLEVLLTLGGLLTVFLGLVVQDKPIFRDGLVAFGLMFTVSALCAYMVVLFPERLRGKKWVFWAVILPRGGVALSFALLTTDGVLYLISEINFGTGALTLIQTVEAVIIAGVFSFTLYGTAILIFRVLSLTIERAEEP